MGKRRDKNGRCLQWARCKKCGYLGYYRYIPGSLSSPIIALPCGHGIGQSFCESVDFISRETARKERRQQKAKLEVEKGLAL